MPLAAKQELAYLGQAEAKQTQERGLVTFKFATDDARLAAIEEEKRKGKAGNAVA
ncbi:MAG: hypothetical protein V3R29_10765 [Candidatus Acidoferrales bacterium]